MEGFEKDLLALRVKLADEISKNETLLEENKRLKAQIEEFRVLYISTVEYASTIENDLEERIRNIQNDCVEIPAENNQNFSDMREKLSLQMAINEQLMADIQVLKRDNEKLRLLLLNTTEFSTFMENEQIVKFDEASRRAVTDHLTGIFNRIKFNESLAREIEKMNTEGYSFTAVMFDIDHFKKINDTYGHQTGDKVLIAITKIVSKMIRKNDIFARWGGEEFMILLPETNLSTTLAITERLREKIASSQNDPAGQVTASFGVAEYKKGEKMSRFIKRVDNAMYRAKELGRNRVVEG
ncbi:MAG: hypothetical protein A2Y33_02760 [Spirochaetes bacterium GWF1_51_8]|nr:MAG: hypothetical protein A2Y33_02760 [Spirochaetes bacterium GWF1_51_8]